MGTSLRPRARPAGLGLPGAPASATSVLARSGLGAQTGFVLRDLGSGRVLEEHQPMADLPPASVAKVLTTLYGLHAMGPAYRFRTAIAVTGSVQNGRVQGDLFLIGGGDPHLDTDGLAALARDVTKAGIFGVTGNAYVVAGALPYQAQIDPGQPPHVGYNPAISGLNLNFNRVHFEWKSAGDRYTLALTARGAQHDPAVSSVEMRVADRGAPVFAYAQAEGRDLWSVSRSALGGGGARWLPVRSPDLYASDVFRTLGEGVNLRLPTLRPTTTVPQNARVVAVTSSAPLDRMATSMLKYSTNLTAEVIGLRAHQTLGGQPGDIAASAAAMAGWLRTTYGLGSARFLNHSGLTDQTRITPAEMVQVLDIAASGPLEAMMKPVTLVDENGNLAKQTGSTVQAKTGTLNFTRALAGYVSCANGRRLAFSIQASDLAARANADADEERPRGARTWLGKARRQEQDLLRRWISLYGAA